MQTVPAPAGNPADRPVPYFASQPATPQAYERAFRAEAARRGLTPAA